jgi:putative permease
MNRDTEAIFGAMARAIYLAAGVVVLLWFLYRITGVLLFFLLALIIAIALNAPITWLESRGMRRSLATVVVIGAVVATFAVLGWMLVPTLVGEFTIFINALPQYAYALADRFAGFFGDYPELREHLMEERGAVSYLLGWLLGAMQDVWRYSVSLVIYLVLGIVLLSVVLFMVINPQPLLDFYVRVMPPHLRDPATRAFARSSQMVVGWVYSSVIISAMKAIPAYFVLSYLGVPAALFWSVFTFFADLVPRLGFYIMSIPPVLVALAIDPMIALWVGLYYWGISELLGNLVAPRIQSATMALHPVYLLFVMLALISAFGLIGALIATPVAGFISAYIDEFYLVRRPADPAMRRRIIAMLYRQPWRARVEASATALAEEGPPPPAAPTEEAEQTEAAFEVERR